MLPVVFIALVLDLLAFTMILPLLPSLLDYYGNQDQDGLYSLLHSAVHGFRQLVGAPDTPRWNSVLFGGLIGSMFSFLQFLASPLMGAMSDVYGRRPVVLLSTIGVGISYVIWAVSHNFSLFVLSRIIGGISKGNVSISTAIVADISPPEKRGRGMAVIGIAFSVGFIIGPMIGAGFSVMNRNSVGFNSAPALFAIFLLSVDLLYIYCFLKETLPSERRMKSLGSGVKAAWPLISPLSLFKFEAVQNVPLQDLRRMQRVGGVYFLYLFFYSGLEFTLTFLTHNRFNYDSMKQGKMFFFIGIIMVIIQGGFVRRLKSGREISFSMKAMLTLIPAFLLVAFAQREIILYAGLSLFAFASAVVVPCLTTHISSYGTVEQKGAVLGIFRSLGALARALGPAAACTLYWSVGAEACYSIGAVCLFIPLFLLYRAGVKTE
ncbi:hypothetical protein CAPTEDRAFT_171281 [Capitella teleta]|uniref:Major facilitator superfamily (MFS) profile domain-containing protein n=1 Tax=Capitella teleta TaxID=283909 RepID=R7US77_CAPTE|nr:hypothetical protein CAPTEDRAFT_171281 [Capitella teleta]|eukprot:ELU06772.1 hypothetical protein CAPTEDRAFT_171281 [Capitella teleta]